MRLSDVELDRRDVRERLAKEGPITLRQAAQLPVLQRNGKPCDRTRLWRWVIHGRYGIKLEAYGDPWMTSAAAVDRFLDAIEQYKRRRWQARHRPPPTPMSRRRLQRMQRELDAVL